MQPTDPVKQFIGDRQIENVHTDVYSYLLARHKKLMIFGTPTIAVCLVASLYLIVTGDHSGALEVFVWPAVTLLCAIGYFFATASSEMRVLLFQQFATRHGMTYAPGGTQYNGIFMDVGNEQKSYNTVHGSFDGNDFWLFNFSYTLGSGKHKQYCKRTVFKIVFPCEFPRMTSFSDMHAFYIPSDYFKNPQKVVLSGDYEHFFDLTVEKDFEIEALQIFTPDLMEKVRFSKHHFSLEFVGNTLFVYTDHEIYVREKLETMFDLVCYLIKKVEPVAKKMEPSLKAMQQKFDVK